jgi:ribosomal protein L24E
VSSPWERCSWCGNPVELGDGFRLAEQAGGRGAVFCRLEHVVPWAIQGAHWRRASRPSTPSVGMEAVCAHCGAALDEGHLVLVRHRGEYRIPDGFCSVDHLLAWAKAGGRWQ